MFNVEYIIKEGDLSMKVLHNPKIRMKFFIFANHLKNLKILNYVDNNRMFNIDISEEEFSFFDDILFGEDRLLISFETEEEAFYFKLKYC